MIVDVWLTFCYTKSFFGDSMAKILRDTVNTSFFKDSNVSINFGSDCIGTVETSSKSGLGTKFQLLL